MASEEMIRYLSRSFPLHVSLPLISATCLPGLRELLGALKDGLDDVKAREVGARGWPADDIAP